MTEHLKYYAKIKSVPESMMEMEITSILEKCDLILERHKLSKHLSGGNKRKLCLGISLIGGSNVVFLDEPTSGLDPVSRRKIWNILAQ